jgi:pantoate--beta-alanine ligase
MGSLHEGHRGLIRAVNESTDVSVVSIFVNPTQFGPDEDLAAYPRDQAADLDVCVAEGVDYLFLPETDELYHEAASTHVEVDGLSDRLEGASRPGHFRGVATVVTKLLNIVGPHVVAFGEKDAQQAAVVRRLVEDLFLDVEVQILPTTRDEDGLALSSRNKNLDDDERAAAANISRALEAVQRLVDLGETNSEKIVEAARTVLENEPLLRVDYIELVGRQTFARLDQLDEEALLVLAVLCGSTRLLDNIRLSPSTASA